MGAEPRRGVETFLFDLDRNLYGDVITVNFYGFERPERKFESLEALKARIEQDVILGQGVFQMRLFYYLIAAPALFFLRVLFWPFKTIFRFAGWFHSWRKARRRFRRADYDDMDGWEFEEYVGELLVRDGFIHVEVTRGSGDQGVDVLARAGRNLLRHPVQALPGKNQQ